jgi:hypothetical protein
MRIDFSNFFPRGTAVLADSLGYQSDRVEMINLTDVSEELARILKQKPADFRRTSMFTVYHFDTAL